MKERIVKIIAALVLIAEVWFIASFEIGVIGWIICGIIGLACLILVGCDFVIITDEDEEIES
jgi:hypothetical protein